MYDPGTSVRNRSSTEPSLSTPAQTQRAKVEDREMDESVLPKRSGSKPRTTPTNPHTQLKQNPKREVVEGLARRVFAIPSVQERPSTASVPGARALWLSKAFRPTRGNVHDRAGVRVHPPHARQQPVRRAAIVENRVTRIRG